MFTIAFSETTEEAWQSTPRTTNPVESLNRQSIHQKGCSLFALLENIYTEDRAHAAKIAAVQSNVTTSYAATPRSKRKRSSYGQAKADNGPPDKRKQLDGSSKQKEKPNCSGKKGRDLIGTRVAIEYEEAGKSGTVQNLCWFEGTITAYNRREGYFIEFDATKRRGSKVAEWSDWIEDLDTDDVRIL